MRSRKVKRDKGGRWQKGTPSPNSKGRPKRKKPARPFDLTDPRDFLNQQVVMKDGTTKFRGELLQLKIFEDAMKGKVTNQRYLQKRFDEAMTASAWLSFEYGQLVLKWIINNENLADPNYKVPPDLVSLMSRWHVLLHRENPEQFPDHMTPEHMIDVFRERHWRKKKQAARR
ncbi:DUF5681 domain-containing protein [Terricaulis silvestris]|uniref:DUF5681 domain-containing protein n=1 Tax=Terricaulis silvestris TaxID=2686094 RepID=A0A6I6MM27_9CAUL|nr:DUF5681 domain-containing protein [Terricaulis silvestris]QGZ96515.1 hypothetical protein DSM104635_03375 [Terricaulis silvestris]